MLKFTHFTNFKTTTKLQHFVLYKKTQINAYYALLAWPYCRKHRTTVHAHLTITLTRTTQQYRSIVQIIDKHLLQSSTRT